MLRKEPLTQQELTELAHYNARVFRGILHTEEMQKRMCLLQQRFDHYGFESKAVQNDPIEWPQHLKLLDLSKFSAYRKFKEKFCLVKH